VLEETLPLSLQPWHASMVEISLQDQHHPNEAESVACRPVRCGVKIGRNYFGGTGAEHFAFSVTELWGLPFGEESMETVASEI